jgi:hypothetical protein
MIYWKVKNRTYTKFMIDSMDHNFAFLPLVYNKIKALFLL